MLRQFPLFPIVAVLLLAQTASGSSLLSGNISGQLTASDVYIATGNLTVPTGTTLTISPGATLKMAPGTSFTINGTLLSQGTAADPVTITSLADDSILGDTGGDGVTQGAPGQWGDLVFNNSTPATQLTSTLIRFGRQITLRSAAPVLTGLTISSMSVVAISADLTSKPSGEGNQAFGSPLNGIELPGGSVTTATVWANLGLPYVIRSGNIFFSSGSNLTIAPGVVVKLFGSSILDLQVPFNAVGTSTAPIVFTSLRDDSAGGNTNLFEGSVNPAPNDWRGVFVENVGGPLSYVQFRYGGIQEGTQLSVAAGANVTMTNCQVAQSSRDGIVFGSGGMGLVQGTTFQSNTRWGIRTASAGLLNLQDNLFDGNGGGISFNGGISNPRLKGNVFRNTNGSVMELGINLFPQDLGGNVGGPNNQLNGIDVLAGVWDRAGSWTMTTLPYVIRSGNVFFVSGSNLTIAPGVVVKLFGGSILDLQVPFNAVGTSTTPIVFTSLRDDSAGGNTNLFEGSVGPAPNDWRGVFVENFGGPLSYVQIRYGGIQERIQLAVGVGSNVTMSHCQVAFSSLDGIRIGGGSTVQITDSLIQSNARWGINHLSGTLTVHNSAFNGNGDAAMANNTPDLVNATGNYWGSPTGPTHANNPGGTGDRIIGNVTFTPFLRFAPGSDILPPRTQLLMGSPTFGQNPTFATSQTLFSLNAIDDSIVIGDGTGVGVQKTWLSLDGAAYSPYGGPFHLASEGMHSLSWYSEDAIPNVEIAHNLLVAVDNTPSLTQILLQGAINRDGNLFMSSTGLVSLTTTDPSTGGVPSGVQGTFVSVDSAPFAGFTTPFPLSTEGLHTLRYYSLDNLQNTEVVQTTAVWVDGTAPQTTLSTAAFTLFQDGVPVITPATELHLVAVDPPGAGIASEVKVTYYSVDSAAPLTYSGSIVITGDGLHSLSFFSEDYVGNQEIPVKQTVRVESQSPLTTISFLGPAFIDPVGNRFLSTTSQIVFAVTGITAGSPVTRYRIDGGTFQTYAAPFSLLQGMHQLDYQSESAVGILEVLQSTSVFVDSLPPETQLSTSSFSLFHNGVPLIRSSQILSLTALDPMDNGMASGVQQILLSVDSAPASAYGYGLHLETEGLHTLQFFSLDQVSNQEGMKTEMVEVDNTPPVTTIQFSTPTHVNNSGQTVLTPESRINFLATDAVAGVAATRYAIDEGFFSVYTQPFSLPEGEHRIDYQSVDRLGNLESPRTANVVVEVNHASPVTEIIYTPAAYVSVSSQVYISAATRIGFSVQPLTAGTVTHYRVDGSGSAPFLVYSTPFSLPAGPHTVEAFSVDSSGGREMVRVFTVRVDAVPPVSTLKAGMPSITIRTFDELEKYAKVHGDWDDDDDEGKDKSKQDSKDKDKDDKKDKKHLPGEVIVVSSYTRLQIEAIDPTDGSGVKDFWVSIGTSPFVQLNGSFTLPVKKHWEIQTVRYYSRDNVLNVETMKTAIVIVLKPKFVLKALLKRPLAGATGAAAIFPPGHLPVSAFLTGPLPISYHLAMAPGSEPKSGFQTLASGSGELNESSVLYQWDTRRLSGYYTLQLTATNGEGETSVSMATVYIGYSGYSRRSGEAGALGPDPAFVLGSVFSFPNPARAGAKPTIHIEVGVADEVVLSIFDIAGRQVHSATLSGLPAVVGSVYAYEYVWDGTIPSGIYYFTVEAKSAGADAIRARGKLAVVR